MALVYTLQTSLIYYFKKSSTQAPISKKKEKKMKSSERNINSSDEHNSIRGAMPRGSACVQGKSINAIAAEEFP